MTSTLSLFAALLFLIFAAYVFLNASPESLASALRITGPIVVCLLGLILLLAGRANIGLPALAFGGLLLARNYSAQRPTTTMAPQISTVLSAWLEMRLNHETGDLDGTVLAGSLEGQILSEMDSDTLLALYADLSGDNESAALMEAYLDRRVPGWRDRADADIDPGMREPFSSGPMSKQEAYQVLGLEPGAKAEEVRSAHRRLMKAVHPDSGGSTFLAARINQAKDTLLE